MWGLIIKHIVHNFFIIITSVIQRHLWATGDVSGRIPFSPVVSSAKFATQLIIIVWILWIPIGFATSHDSRPRNDHENVHYKYRARSKILLQRSFFQNFRYFIRFLFRISWKNFKNIKKDVIRVRLNSQLIFKKVFSSTNTRTLVALIRNYYWFRTFLVLSSVFRFQTFDQLPIKIHKNIKNNWLLSFLRCSKKKLKKKYKSEMFILVQKWYNYAQRNWINFRSISSPKRAFESKWISSQNKFSSQLRRIRFRSKFLLKCY